jgi:hypothetical protein
MTNRESALLEKLTGAQLVKKFRTRRFYTVILFWDRWMQPETSHRISIISHLIWTSRQPLWSSGQNCWLQIQRLGFDSRRYQPFWEAIGLERGPLSLVSAIEGLIGRKSSGYGLESRYYDRRDPSRWPRGSLYPQNLALTSPSSGGCSIGIVRSWTQATEFSFILASRLLCWSIMLMLNCVDLPFGINFSSTYSFLLFLFSILYIYTNTTCFGLIDHHQVYKLDLRQ